MIACAETTLTLHGTRAPALLHACGRGRTQATVLSNLRDPDVSIRRRALDLLFTMCDGGAAVEVVEELVSARARGNSEGRLCVVQPASFAGACKLLLGGRNKRSSNECYTQRALPLSPLSPHILSHCHKHTHHFSRPCLSAHTRRLPSRSRT